MIWLTLRQHRGELLTLGIVFVFVASVLLVTGAIIHHTYDVSGFSHCLNATTWAGACGQAYDAFELPFDKVRGLMPWLNLLPMFVGLLLGVPILAREYEQGTYKLAWTQSVSRLRWLTWKIGVLLVAVLAFAVGMTALMTWWNAPFDSFTGHFTLASWDFEGVMPAAFTGLAFALGTAAGGFFRRVVPAVAALFAYIPLWLFSDDWLRTVLPPPVAVHTALNNLPALRPQDWLISEGVMDSAGNPVYGVAACPSAAPCATTQGLRAYLIYQPASRFWEIQVIEAGILCAAAVLLLVLAVRRVRS